MYRNRGYVQRRSAGHEILLSTKIKTTILVD